MLKTHCSVFLIFILLKCSAPKTVLDSALNDCNPAIKKVLKEKKYEIQILLSQIIRNPTGEISFEENSYQIDEDQYFYPASTVKLPIAILALQKLNTLKSKGIQINGNTPFYITSRKGDTIIKSDSTNKKGFVTVNHLIKKIFLVSDNDAYNYLFDFLGRDYINIELNKRNLKQSQIRHKFLFGADNINTWEYTFFDKNQNIVFHQPSLNSELNLKPHKLKGLFKGNAYKSSGNLLNEPMNFSKKNRILEFTDEKLVSIDFNHNSASSIVDGSLTNVIGENMGKISAWYDNEWGFSNRMCDIAEHLHKIS